MKDGKAKRISKVPLRNLSILRCLSPEVRGVESFAGLAQRGSLRVSVRNNS
jgi:hypothetical protein